MKKTVLSVALVMLLVFVGTLCCCGEKEHGETEGIETEYQVTFDTVGGNLISPQYVLSGKKATKPTDPVKPDDSRKTYTFKEWQLNGVRFDFNTPITGNITLTAVYDAETAFTPGYPPQVL